MIKKFFIVAILLGGSFSLNSCRDTVEKKTVIREVDQDEPADVKVVKEEDEGIIERTGEAIDEEVNEEINEEIEKIGDEQ